MGLNDSVPTRTTAAMPPEENVTMKINSCYFATVAHESYT